MAEKDEIIEFSTDDKPEETQQDTTTEPTAEDTLDQDGDVITDLNSLPPDLLQKLFAMLGAAPASSEGHEFSSPLDAFAAGLGASSSPRKTPDEIAESFGIKRDDEDKNGPFANKHESSINEVGKNKRELGCPFCCKSIIFLENVATHVKKDVFLMYPKATTKDEGETYSDFWKVDSKSHFENIAVRRGHEDDTFRYLTCSDCDLGPVGITFNSDNNKIFYIADRRVLYR